jgi:hypothetical protein
MTDIDTITLEIYNKMKTAFATGNVLTYAGELAGKLLNITPAAVETVSRSGTVRPATPQPRSVVGIIGEITPPEPVLAPNARRNADGTERSDSVKTSRL